MIRRRGIQPEHTGAEALAITVPNVGSLPWEAIAEFREHPGSQEARARLRQFDARGAAGERERGFLDGTTGRGRPCDLLGGFDTAASR
jgi:hypothetical protein